MKKVFIITGANGFLGNNLVRELVKDKNNEVRALVLPDDQIHSLDGLNCKIYKGDVTKKDSLNAIFAIEESNTELYVIHCAAIVYIKAKYNPKVYEVNVNGTKNIIDQVLKTKAKLVYVSSVHAIPEKPNHAVITETKDFDPKQVVGEYAKTKAVTAKYVLEMVEKKGLNACIVHPSGIIGPNDFGSSHLTQLLIDFANGKLKACVHGGYDFVDVRDVVSGIIQACYKGKKGSCYILSNRYVPVKELLDIVSQVRNIKKVKFVIPMWLAKLTAPLSEKYYTMLKQPPLYTKYSLYTLTSNSNFSNQKAKKELNYKTRDFEKTIKDTVLWLEEQGRIH